MSRFANSKALQPPAAVRAAPSVEPVRPPVLVVSPSLATADLLSNPDEGNSLRRLGVFLLLAYGFVRFSFLSEIANHITNSRPFFVMALGIPTAALMLISGGLRRTFRARPAYFIAGLMFWLALVIPFSFWRGGSLQILLPAFETEFSMLFLLAGLLITAREVNWFLSVLALSGAFLVLASFYYGTEDFGRFGFSFGTMQNANDYGTHLLLLSPFLVLVSLNSSSSFLRFSAASFALLGSYLVLKTGSRGALLALFAMIVFFFLKTTMAQRAVIVATLVILGLIMLFAIPRVTLQRYLTLVDSSVDRQADSSYEMERGGRLFGVQKISAVEQPHAYRDAPVLRGWSRYVRCERCRSPPGAGEAGNVALDAQLLHGDFERVWYSWFPAIYGGTRIYLLAVDVDLRARAKRDPRFARVRNTAFCMMLSILGFSICIFFASMSYRYYLPSLVGLTVAFAAAAQREMNNTSPARPVLSKLPWAPRTTR